MIRGHSVMHNNDNSKREKIQQTKISFFFCNFNAFGNIFERYLIPTDLYGI